MPHVTTVQAQVLSRKEVCAIISPRAQPQLSHQYRSGLASILCPRLGVVAQAGAFSLELQSGGFDYRRSEASRHGQPNAQTTQSETNHTMQFGRSLKWQNERGFHWTVAFPRF